MLSTDNIYIQPHREEEKQVILLLSLFIYFEKKISTLFHILDCWSNS